MLLAAVGLYLVAMGVRVYVRKYYIFLPDYVRWHFSRPGTPSGRPMHVFFLFVDHFEPDRDVDRVRRWSERYVALARRHRDSTGRAPQHTWFYPGEQAESRIFEELQRLTQAGLGEVELHYHHDHDTEDTLRAKLRDAIGTFQRFGFLKTIDGRTRFAFIHGDEGLDNSMGPVVCGVNQELRLLRELGCFGDFTFPAIYTDAQPPFVNTIYAARDDDRPKSYRTRYPLAALATGTADLMILQGPLVFAPTTQMRRLFVELDDGNIHPPIPASSHRVDRWIGSDIHVAQRPDWLFVKVFAHGVSTREDEDVVLGPTFDSALTYLERRYNDGRDYVLHYITAREAYNLVRAAVDGATGNPEPYFDRVVPPYAANEPVLTSDVMPHR